MDSRYNGPEPSDRRAPRAHLLARLLELLRHRRLFPSVRRYFRWFARIQGRAGHIVILEFGPSLGFGALQEYWINRHSHRFSASLNRGYETADIFWVYCPDPLISGIRAELDAVLSAHPAVPVINRPSVYDFYHNGDSFTALRAAGVSVPREIQAHEEYQGLVVYKQANTQAGRKSMEPYSGPREDFRAFEFLDEPDDEGFYRRYRAFWIAGWVRASKLYRSRNWNVCFANIEEVSYGFDITDSMQQGIRRLAEISGLDFFAVDFLIRIESGDPAFTDINVCPRTRAMASTEQAVRSLFPVHTFDTRMLLGLPEPDGRSAVVSFDEAMQNFITNGRS